MKISELISTSPVSVQTDDSVSSAARLLSRRNIGVLPVTDADGMLSGMVTDRDIVLRCIAAGKDPESTCVGEIMSDRVISVSPDDEASKAAELMSREKIRRLPVVRDGRLCGVLSLSDIARSRGFYMEAARAFAEISSNVSRRSGRDRT
ncbi:MAG: CBS domain-containing protein [Oscillospiraceae bacterium]|nr:CBS domain-containing protein [Oscillospiraceae bacterium]